MIYYRYIYFRLYKFFLSISRTDIPELNAHLIITFLGLANLIAFYGIFKLNAPDFHLDPLFGKSIVVTAFCVIGLVNYLIFIKGKKYNKLLLFYERLNKNEFNISLAKLLFFGFSMFWIATLITCAVLTKL